MINEKNQVMDRSEFIEILIGPSTGSGLFLRFYKQSGISPWPKALSKKRAYIGVGPFCVEMAGRTVRYSNFSVTIDIPFDPVLRLQLMHERGYVRTFDYWFDKASLYQNLLESGKVKNLGELARMEKVSKARISQIMALRNLAPEIKNWLLEIADSTLIPKQRITEKKLRQIATIKNHKQQIKKFREIMSGFLFFNKSMYPNF